MDEQSFWQLIASAKESAHGDIDAEIDALTHSLERRDAGEIEQYAKVMDRLMARAYTWDLWAAAYIINGGCSDDGFEYFRAWLISQGRDVFEAALRNPETLVDIADPDVDAESMLYVASVAHERKTGKALPPNPSSVAREPSGTPWDEGSVSKKYPRLAAKFG